MTMDINNLSKADVREILFKETGGRCIACGCPREACDSWSAAAILRHTSRGGSGPEDRTILCSNCVIHKHAGSIPDYVNSRPFKIRLRYWWTVNKAFILRRITSAKRAKLMEGFHLLGRGKSFTRAVKKTTRNMTFFNETNGCCIYCGRQLTTGHFTLDHIVPRYFGGKRYDENLVTACDICNSAKGNQPVHDYVSTFSYRELRGYVNRVKDLKSQGLLPEKKAQRLLNYENAHTYQKRIRIFTRLFTFKLTVEEL